MFTVLLALVDSRKTNKAFQPELLYFGTFLIDLIFVDAFIKSVFGV